MAALPTPSASQKVIGIKDEVIGILVGPDEEEFLIDKSVLTATSELFKAAFGNPSAEQGDGRIKLEDDDPNAFQIYVHWLYKRKIEVSVSTPTRIFRATSVGTLLGEDRTDDRNEQEGYIFSNEIDRGLLNIEVGREDEDLADRAGRDDPATSYQLFLLANAFLIGDDIQDEAFMTAIESKFINLHGKNTCFKPLGDVARYIWINSEPYSRPHHLVVARAVSLRSREEIRGFYLHLKRMYLEAQDKETDEWKEINEWKDEMWEYLALFFEKCELDLKPACPLGLALDAISDIPRVLTPFTKSAYTFEFDYAINLVQHFVRKAVFETGAV